MSVLQLNRFFPLVQSAVLLICDVQERFRPLIYNMNTVIRQTELLNLGCNMLNIPCIISEQNPKALGGTVNEITKFEGTYLYPKTSFSMINEDILARIGEKRQVSQFL